MLSAAVRRRASPLLRRTTFTSTTGAAAASLENSNGGDSSSRGAPPIRVALTESAGRGVFATRFITSGELIHTAQPLVAHPSSSLLRTVCYYCLRRLGKDASLDADKSACCHFCSEQCENQANKVFYEVERKADWSRYDEQCRLRGVKYPLLVKRLACMIVSGAASVDSLDILQPTSLTQRMVSEMEEEFKLLKCALLEAQLGDSPITSLTKQWYISVLARIRINAFRIELAPASYEDLFASAVAAVTADAAVGNALYMLPSFYNHDCDPNAHIIWIENADAKLKTLRDVKAGEELRICYIDASMDREARRSILLEGFGFECMCQRCLSGD